MIADNRSAGHQHPADDTVADDSIIANQHRADDMADDDGIIANRQRAGDMTGGDGIIERGRRRFWLWMPVLRRPVLRRPQLGGVEWAFLGIVVVAAALRLWELNGRAMHYDEAIHLHFAWKLANGVGFAHSPWMHGPLQIELVAVLLRFVADTDFIARLPYAVFGVVLSGLPYLLRERIGDKGAVCAGVMLTLSPSLLYFSRFGRNDILMAVWATLLLILFWRYIATRRNRYLYLTAPTLAMMLATKETAYFIIFFLGTAALCLGWQQFRELVMRRRGWSELSGAAGYLVFLAALTLPQAAALASVIQGPLGLTLAAADAGATGETGAPVWAAPFVTLPVWTAPAWAGIVAAAGLAGGMAALAIVWWRERSIITIVAIALAALLTMAAAYSWFALPLSSAASESSGGESVISESAAAAYVYADYGLGAGLLLLAIFAMAVRRQGARRIALVVGSALLLSLLWLTALHGGLPIPAGAFPEGAWSGEAAAAASDLAAGRVAVNYLLPVAILIGLLAAGVAGGTAWGGGVWLAAAGIFYAVWSALFTTLFTNPAGWFTGGWQSLGYWMAQQEEARGNQPWYYYAVGLSVYELVALVFGLIAVVWLVRRREPFGLVLAGWVVATLAVYTTAGEKMPWLLVNLTVPLALAAGMLLGHLADGVDWRRLERRSGWLLVLAPAWVILAVWVAWLAAGGVGVNIAVWLGALVLLPGAAGIAWLLRGHPAGVRTAALGMAALLLGFGTVAAMRAAYTYDESYPEILAYAQGSADLPAMAAELRQSALAAAGDDAGAGDDAANANAGAVKVDYDMWYPFQWYVRQETRDGSLQFDTFCADTADAGASDEGQDDAAPAHCRRVGDAGGADDGGPGDGGPQVYLVESQHTAKGANGDDYERTGPMRNLLWYPETYRRPHEARTETPFWEQLRADTAFFAETAADPGKWREALDYIIARRQDSDWYSAEFYRYDRN